MTGRRRLPVTSLAETVPAQVCVAILLDNFIRACSATREEEEAGRLRDSAGSGSAVASALDPLLEVLAVNHSDDADLSLRIQDLFLVCVSVREGERERKGGKK